MNSFYPNNQFIQNPNYVQGAYNSYTTQTQNPMQPVVQEVPFVDVRYGTIEEAKSRLVAPSKSIMVINRNLGEFYIKSANQMGEPFFETFKYSKVDDTLPKQNELDISQFVKTETLNDYITKEDLKTIIGEIEQIKQKLEQK